MNTDTDTRHYSSGLMMTAQLFLVASVLLLLADTAFASATCSIARDFCPIDELDTCRPCDQEEYVERVEAIFNAMNKQLLSSKRASAIKLWEELTGEGEWDGEGDESTAQEGVVCGEQCKNAWCNNLQLLPKLTDSQKKQIYLLCAGPKYDDDDYAQVTTLLTNLSRIYSKSTVCQDSYNCLAVEPDLTQLMATSQDPIALTWAWMEWHELAGLKAKNIYPELVRLLNRGAANNGYHDIGEWWRQELNIPHFFTVIHLLYLSVREMYWKLHAFVRYRLSEVYDFDIEEAIPVQFLGNMWPQDWSPLLPLLLDNKINLSDRFSAMNLSIADLLVMSDRFYTSLGLPSMPPSFWLHSQTERVKGHRPNPGCHPLAVNMFQNNDYRMVVCKSSSFKDLRVVHHEMGHIQYFMAYSHLPVLFQEGASPPFHEAVGDSISLAVMTPEHLSRIGFVDPSWDKEELQLTLLLHSALTHLPQTLFALTLESWRWNVMGGHIRREHYNKLWWDIMYCVMGVEPPLHRSYDSLDAASNYHVLANTPYIQYFLSEFLQVQIFEALCDAANEERGVPANHVPLHKCNIFGSKRAGRLLKKMMQEGSSGRWQDALSTLTGGKYSTYSALPLARYYRPLFAWLDRQIELNDIPVWDTLPPWVNIRHHSYDMMSQH